MDGAGGRIAVGPGFRWVARPYARARRRGLLALGVVLAAGAAVAWVTRSLAFGAFAWVLLGASVASYFVATRYEVAAEGLWVERLGQRVLWRWDNSALPSGRRPAAHSTCFRSSHLG